MHIYWPTQKKRSSNAIVIIFTVVITTILIGGIWALTNKNNSPKPIDTNEPTYLVWELITMWWIIDVASPLTPYFTHILTNELWEIFGIKSAEIDLNQYENPVQIRWTIVEIRDQTIIIQVTAIDGWSSPWTELTPSNPQFYWYRNAWIGIDLSSSQWFSLQENTQKDIVLWDTKATSPSEREIFTITPFVCTPTDPLRDCEALRRRFQSTNPEKFIAWSNLTYYKLPETQTWVTFTDKIWFFLAPRSKNWSSFSSLISFLTEEDIKKYGEKELSRLCKDNQSSMSGITSQAIDQKANGKIELKISWPSSRETQAECIIEIRVWNKISGTLISYTAAETIAVPWNEQNKETTPKPTENEILQIPKPDTTGDSNEIWMVPWINQTFTMENPGRPSTFTWRVSLPSVRWYTIYFSNPRIRYGGTILTTPEIFGWLLCSYKVDVAVWSQDNNENEPTTTIYECKWKTTSSQLNEHWLRPLFQDDTLLFVVQHKTDALVTMAIYVEMNQ
jgi:preprotein translocase subunit SecE